MRRLLIALGVLALAGCAARAEGPAGARPIRVTAQAVPLDPKDPRAERIGRFAYAGGLHLTTRDSSLFGGFSDLKVSPSGDLVSESDEGSLMRAHIRLDARGRLAGLDHATLAPLTGPRGAPLDGKRESDAEGVAVWPNGDLMVSFERDHRIWLYPHRGGDPVALPEPPIAMPDNEGMEGLALAPSQGPDAYWVGVEGGSIWLCRLKAACRQYTGLPKPPLLFRLPALAETPDGRLAILHHSWTPLTGNRVHILIVTIPKTPEGASRQVDRLELSPRLNIDNFEGLAVVARPGGGDRLYVISDDNFSPSQRTLLEAFDWTPRR